METAEVVNEISASHDRDFVDSNIWLHLSFPQLSTPWQIPGASATPSDSHVARRSVCAKDKPSFPF